MRIRVALLALLFVFFILAPTLARWYTDWLWFGEVGYRRVFWVPLLSRVAVTVVAGGTLFALFLLNLRPLLRRPPLDDVIDLEPRSRGSREFRRVLRRQQVGGLVMAVLAVVAFLSGLGASVRWPMFQQFIHARPFGVTDPIFERDIGFFVFRLPVYQFVESWLFGWLVLIFLVVAAGYYLGYASSMLRNVWSLPAPVRTHLSLLGAAIVLVRGWGFWLDKFALEYSRRGAIVGAGYTDVHAVLPVLRLLTLLFAICGLLLLINIRRRTWRPALAISVVILVAWVVGLGVIPRFVQQVRVSPNELTVETPYIRHGISSTLRAFGLDRIREQEFSAEPITAAIVSRNRATVDNVRLWDYRPLLSAYQQLQALRPYYLFRDVDIDRYQVDGVQRQVMLAARELEVGRLAPQARTWVNEHLVFTHGYGVVMSPVNRVSEEGMPEFFLKDIPPVGAAELPVTRPQIYFGEQTGRYVIVNTKVQELDYPSGDENVYASYAGRGGIRLTAFRRLAFAYRYGDLRLMISSDITPNSRLMFARDITTRVRRLAPFLSYDRDPYVVLVGGGLKWVIDAYTTSNRYPYSTPASTEINYIRNSVKVVIDAYDGAVDFYVVDASDPLVQSFTSIFPELFKPASQMPRDLAAHLRYPVDLFEIQARMYATFHMRDPRVFYNREDVWSVPNELFGNETVVVEPYYVTMRLGNDPQAEFILILPFTPAGRDNLIAWMAARNDGPGYGELVVYRFPKDRLAFGPMQVESRINQDPIISQQLTLWNQEGSRVIRGNLLVIPMENALMYVEPLFLQAERSQLPELKRVIVASGPRIIMEETLEGAIARLLGRLPPSTTPSPPGAAPTPSAVNVLIRQAVETYEHAQRLLRQGDLAGYSREIERLGQILRQIEKSQ